MILCGRVACLPPCEVAAACMLFSYDYTDVVAPHLTAGLAIENGTQWCALASHRV